MLGSSHFLPVAPINIMGHSLRSWSPSECSWHQSWLCWCTLGGVPTEIVQEEKTLCSEIPGNISCFLPAGSLGIWAGESRHSSGFFCIHLTKGFDVHCPRGPPAPSKGSDSARVLLVVSLMTTQRKTRQNVYSKSYSQAVTHPSSKRSQPCLTSEIRQKLVYPRWYGLSRGKILVLKSYLWSFIHI